MAQTFRYTAARRDVQFHRLSGDLRLKSEMEEGS
jgi:hypothetical protein